MLNLWRFFSRFSAFFLFIIYFTISIILLVRNNDFQRASTFNTSNQYVGSIYQKVNDVNKYLHLSVVNDSLAKENVALRNQLKSSFFDDSVVTKAINDTINRTQYEYIVGEVVNKSITSRNNYITINRGAKHGIKKGMGVIGPNGVVGIVWNVSDDFSSLGPDRSESYWLKSDLGLLTSTRLILPYLFMPFLNSFDVFFSHLSTHVR